MAKKTPAPKVSGRQKKPADNDIPVSGEGRRPTKKLAKTSAAVEITGQIHCRIAGPSVRSGCIETHDLVSVVGILSVPKGTMLNDQMFTIIGGEIANTAISLMVVNEGHTFDSRGDSHGSLLVRPIWRC